MFSKHVIHNLSAYLDKELAASEYARVESHLRDCERCSAALQEIQFGAQVASSVSTKTAPEMLWRNIETAAALGGRTEKTKSLSWFQVGAAIAGVAATLALSTGLSDLRPIAPENSWEVSSVRGTARIGTVPINENSRLRPGDTLQTNSNSEVEVKIANIGQLELDPNSTMRLLSTNSDQHRIALDRGKITARTWAPPRLFVVETPSVNAIDLGCIYTCEVQRDGSTLLQVILGLVALDFHGRETTIPAGALCRTRAGAGMGSPYFEDASERLKQALDVVDFGKDEDERARQLDVVLRESRLRDTLTLWYLIPRLSGEQRGKVVDRMIELASLPDGASRAGIMSLDNAMLDAWKSQLENRW